MSREFFTKLTEKSRHVRAYISPPAPFTSHGVGEKPFIHAASVSTELATQFKGPVVSRRTAIRIGGAFILETALAACAVPTLRQSGTPPETSPTASTSQTTETPASTPPPTETPLPETGLESDIAARTQDVAKLAVIKYLNKNGTGNAYVDSSRPHTQGPDQSSYAVIINPGNIVNNPDDPRGAAAMEYEVSTTAQVAGQEIAKADEPELVNLLRDKVTKVSIGRRRRYSVERVTMERYTLTRAVDGRGTSWTLMVEKEGQANPTVISTDPEVNSGNFDRTTFRNALTQMQNLRIAAEAEEPFTK